MASSSDKVTSNRWEIANFGGQYDANSKRNGQMSGSNFSLTVQSSTFFALVLQFSASGLWYTTFGVVLKEFGSKKPLEFDLKIWLENDAGQKFYEESVQKQSFAKVGDEYKVQTSSGGTDWNLFNEVYNNRKALFICCEITDFSPRTPALKSLQKFHQNHWSAYEQEMHDAVVKVGSTEFKVFKAFFVTQSDYFAKMFSSGFKEGVTSTVEAEDVSEDTMKHLIKWLYTGQVEDESKAEELFKAADKYNIERLKETCTEIMLDTFDDENAFARLILGVIHNSDQLKEASLDVIAEMSGIHWAKFTMSQEWREFVRKNASVADEISELVLQKFNTGES